MKKLFISLFPFVLFFLLTCIIFRPYLLKNQVPFPGNLLASFYEPYSSYSWNGYAGGIPDKQVGFDDIRIYYPMRTITDAIWKNFAVPLWNPYYFSGNVQLATYQSVVFFPLSFLYFLLPQIDAWSFIIFLAPFLSMVTMYIFLNDSLKSKKASILSAIGYGFSGYILANTEDIYMAVFSALFLPIILLGIKKLYEKVSVRGFLSIALGIIGTILSGWFQVSLYILIFAFVYALYLAWVKKVFKNLVFIVLAFVFGISATALQIAPTIEAYANSVRGTTDVRSIFELYLVPWYHLVTYVAPDFFGNPGTYNYFGGGSYSEKVLFVSIPIFVLAFYGIFVSLSKKFQDYVVLKKFDVAFYAITLVVSLILGFSNPISWLTLYSLHLPLFSTMLPSRIFIISAFSLCYLAAVGFIAYEKKQEKLPLVIALIIAGCCLVIGWFMTIFAHRISSLQQVFEFTISFQKGVANVAVAKKNLLLPSLLYVVIVCSLIFGFFKRFTKITYYILLILVAFSGIYFANKYLFFSDRLFTFAQVPVLQKLQSITGINRVWTVGTAHIERNFLVQYKLQSPEGYDALSSGRYAELLYAAGKDGMLTPSETPRADAVIPSAKNISDIANNPLRIKLLSLLGIKYIIGPNTSFHNSLLSPVWNDGKFIIYRFLPVYPRAFFVDNLIMEKNKQAILTALFSPSTDLRKTAIVENPISLAKTNVYLSANAIITNYSTNSVTIKTSTNKTALLFLSDNYYPGWHAYVDGKEKTIYRTDYSFRGVLVPEGNHVVKFVYSPLSFTLGVVVSLVSLLGIVIVCFLL